MKTLEMLKRELGSNIEKVVLVSDSFEVPLSSNKIFNSLRVLTLPSMLYYQSLSFLKHQEIDFTLSQAHIFHLTPICSYFLKLLKKIPMIVKIHDLFPSLERPIEANIERTVMLDFYKSLLKSADFALIQSHEMRYLMKRESFSTENLLIFPNTISIRFREKTDVLFKKVGNQLVEKYPILESQGVKLIYVGKIYKDRGLKTFIDYLNYVARKLDVKLIIIGRQMDENIIRLLKKEEYQKNVSYIGEIPHELVPIFIKFSDLPIGSLKRGWHTIGAVPRKVLEYFILEKPVLSIKGSATRELINEKTSLIINNLEDLKQLNRLIEEANLSKLGLHAFETVKKYYITENYKRLMYEIISNIILGSV
jgi:glycosyltransferase involved in cell wall biosynthesis